MTVRSAGTACAAAMFGRAAMHAAAASAVDTRRAKLRWFILWLLSAGASSPDAARESRAGHEPGPRGGAYSARSFPVERNRRDSGPQNCILFVSVSDPGEGPLPLLRRGP